MADHIEIINTSTTIKYEIDDLKKSVLEFLTKNRSKLEDNFETYLLLLHSRLTRLENVIR